jgi:hypothetical protein
MALARRGITPPEEQGFFILQGFAFMLQGLAPQGFLAFAMRTPAACTEERVRAEIATKAIRANKILNLFHIFI